jgi:hypothetical protein
MINVEDTAFAAGRQYVAMSTRARCIVAAPGRTFGAAATRLHSDQGASATGRVYAAIAPARRFYVRAPIREP